MDFTGSTKNLLNSFVKGYPNFSTSLKASLPFVYVNQSEMKLLAREVCFDKGEDTTFALALAQDGLIEILKLEE